MMTLQISEHDGHRRPGQEPEESSHHLSPLPSGNGAQAGVETVASFVALTVMGHLSIDETTARSVSRPSGRLQLVIPELSKFAIGCLAVGIGSEGGEAVAALASAPWFSHLRRAARGPVREVGQEATSALNDMIGRIRGPHVVSVALPRQPGRPEIDAACAVARMVRQRDAYVVVVTVSEPDRAAISRLGRAFDCIIDGDGSLHHHWYPARTVTEPAVGRLVCYDLYDVCLLWAGRLGMFGALVPNADGMHVEVSADVETLAEVDRLVSMKAAGLDDPRRVCLFNVVAGARDDATAVSFSDNPLIRQDRRRTRDSNKKVIP